MLLIYNFLMLIIALTFVKVNEGINEYTVNNSFLSGEKMWVKFGDRMGTQAAKRSPKLHYDVSHLKPNFARVATCFDKAGKGRK